MDLCGSRHTPYSIAQHCLPNLVHVIRAESILFVPAKTCDISGVVTFDLERTMSVGASESDTETNYQFLRDSLSQLSHGVRVANTGASEEHLVGYPGIRNSIVVSVSKGPCA